jgi:hypothetical protein
LNEPESFEPWPLEARHKFEASQMWDWLRDAYIFALWTAQRESDILRVARARFDGQGFVIGQGWSEAKRGTGRKGPVVTLYVLLRAYLASRTSTGLLFVADKEGHPIRADTAQDNAGPRR